MNLVIIYLTPNMPLIHTLFTRSRRNMGEICGLKFHLLYVHASQFFFEIPPCKKGVILLLNLPFWQKSTFL
jgi:hypothetical protein